MKISPILLIGGAGLAYLAYTKFSGLSNTANKLEWGNPKLKFGKASLTQVPVDVTLDVINPTSNSIFLDYFHGSIIYQNAAISSFTFKGDGKRLQIAAQRTTQITFTVLVKNKAALTAIKNVLISLFSGKKTDSILSVKGSLFAAGIDIPVAFKYDVAKGEMVDKTI